MPKFKTLIQAEKWGKKHYLLPEYKLTIHGTWKVKEGYGQGVQESVSKRINGG